MGQQRVPLEAHPEIDLLPSEYFRRQIYGCFWFEADSARFAIEQFPDNVLFFEYIFPHPTCQHPGPASNRKPLPASMRRRPSTVSQMTWSPGSYTTTRESSTASTEGSRCRRAAGSHPVIDGFAKEYLHGDLNDAREAMLWSSKGSPSTTFAALSPTPEPIFSA